MYIIVLYIYIYVYIYIIYIYIYVYYNIYIYTSIDSRLLVGEELPQRGPHGVEDLRHLVHRQQHLRRRVVGKQMGDWKWGTAQRAQNYKAVRKTFRQQHLSGPDTGR